MEEFMMKARERYLDEFNRVSSQDKWDVSCVELMKNLLKCVYYVDVICAMDEGNDYPASDSLLCLYHSGNSRGLFC